QYIFNLYIHYFVYSKQLACTLFRYTTLFRSSFFVSLCPLISSIRRKASTEVSNSTKPEGWWPAAPSMRAAPCCPPQLSVNATVEITIWVSHGGHPCSALTLSCSASHAGTATTPISTAIR